MIARAGRCFGAAALRSVLPIDRFLCKGELMTPRSQPEAGLRSVPIMAMTIARGVALSAAIAAMANGPAPFIGRALLVPAMAIALVARGSCFRTPSPAGRRTGYPPLRT